MKILAVFCLLALIMGASANAWAASRYSMMPAEGGGFIRLDTQTGAMDLCRNTDGNWTCRPVNEQTSSLTEEIKRLKAENERLQTENKHLQGFAFPKGPADTVPQPPTSEPRGQFQLPSEEDVDQALTYLQRMFRKFKDKMEELEKETKKPPDPATPL